MKIRWKSRQSSMLGSNRMAGQGVYHIRYAMASDTVPAKSVRMVQSISVVFPPRPVIAQWILC